MTLTKTKRQDIRREIRRGKTARAEAAKLSNAALAEKLEVSIGMVQNVLYHQRPNSKPDHQLILDAAAERERDLELAERYCFRAIAERHGVSIHQVRRLAAKVNEYDREKTDNDAGAGSEAA